MKKVLLTGALICSISLTGGWTAFGEEAPTWKYSEENMEKTYTGKWENSRSGFQFFLPTEGWEEYDPSSEMMEETESEILGTETEAETAAGTETEAETAAGTETEAETAAGTETEAETAAGTETEAETATGTETEAETEAETEESVDAGVNEYAVRQPEDGITLRLYHLESEDESYPTIEDLLEMFKESVNTYLVECNGIKAVHFDKDNSENLAFPEIFGDKESGFAGSVAVISVRCDDREDRELFADELFSSIQLISDDPTVSLDNGLICSRDYILWQVQEASEKYVRLLSHKKFVSNEDEDEPNLATGFALMDLNDDGKMELLVQYKGSDLDTEGQVTDYALYTFSEGEEKLLQTMEGRGERDSLIYYPDLKIIEYDTYSYDDYNEDEYSDEDDEYYNEDDEYYDEDDEYYDEDDEYYDEDDEYYDEDDEYYNEDKEEANYFDCYQYDGKEILHSDYYELGLNQKEDEIILYGTDFMIPNTEENRQTIAERMQETMEEHMGES